MAASKTSRGRRVPRENADAVLRTETEEGTLAVRRIHRRDLNRVWEFLKLVFRDVNRETVEYQRPRTKRRFLEIYEEEGVEQLLFEITLPEVLGSGVSPGRDKQVVLRSGASPSGPPGSKDASKTTVLVGYAECAFEVVGKDSWINVRYFQTRDMRPLFVEELAVHPGFQGRGIGAYMMEQLEHLAKLRGCTHLVLEVAENNDKALRFYRTRNFQKLDAAIFLAKKVEVAADLLPPRPVSKRRTDASSTEKRKGSVRAGPDGSTKIKGDP